jgi:hypothetical protein
VCEKKEYERGAFYHFVSIADQIYVLAAMLESNGFVLISLPHIT